jgi:hypothetical protein
VRSVWSAHAGCFGPTPSRIHAELLALLDWMRQSADMTTVARCLTIDQALLMRSLLEGCGLKAYVPDEVTAQTDPVIFMGSMNSIRVQVADEDVAAARAILAQNGLPAET